MENLNNKTFNHFKIHTQYSICEGALQIDTLSEYCKKNKIRSIGISDTSNLSGALEFSEKISKCGSQPIIGAQIKFNYKEEIDLLPLIAKNEKGYKRIIELTSKSYLDNDDEKDPNCNFDELLKNDDDIIVLSGGLKSLSGILFKKGKLKDLETLYTKLKEVFAENFYIEIQRHNDNNEKDFEKFNLNLSYKLKIPIIATQEVYYLGQDMHEAHDALMCIGEKTYVNDVNRLKLSDQHYLKNSSEMIDLFKDLPEALENNFNLSLRCSFRPQGSDPMLPNISTKTENPNENLINISKNGLINKFENNFNIKKENLKNNKKYQIYLDRLNHEINIITKMNYSSYFLIVSDYIKWAKNNNIPVGPGRGSGAGSLVAWCLSITDVDPIQFDLIFERFLNPDRISMPDFDIDFCEEKRDLVFDYLKKKYKNSVAHIITFGKLKARMVIRDVGRVMGLPYGFVDSICKMIPFDPSRPMNLTQSINSEPRLQNLIKEDRRVKKLVDLSLKLEGLNRNVATHAAGVVIADKKLTETVPLYKDKNSNLLLPSTQFDMYSAENAGLVKFDFLGLKTLTIIKKTEQLVKKKNKNFDIEKINFDDKKVFDLLSSGNTVGLFQLESSGMRDALTQMKPNRLEDIIALVALYRPGPMSNIPIYNDCKHKIREPDYLHPKLEKILKPTYGVIIYQEQVMQIAQILSGFTAGEADLLRRAMGKKKRAELEKQKNRFIEGAFKNGINKEVAASIFLKIEPFAEYGFNKSHAAAYAIIAYQTAYLKTHFKHEFFAASMSMELSNQKKLSEFYEELRRLEIKVIRPDINRCFSDFSSDGINFFYALGALKNVGYEAISNIVSERINNGNFKSLNDFISRISHKDINKLQLEGLVKAGAFDNLESNRNSLFSSIPNMILKSKNIDENRLANQIDLFNDDNSLSDDFLKKIDDWKTDEKLNKEFETLGFFISDHPLNQYKDIYQQYKIKSFSEFETNKEESEINIAATILKVQEKKTQKGTSYAIVKFSDLSSIFELFLFSEVFEINRESIKEGNSLILTIYKNVNDNENRFKRINVKKVTSIGEVLNKPIKDICFEVDSLEKFKSLKSILQNKGNTNVSLKYVDNKRSLYFKLEHPRNITRKDINELKNQHISTLID